MSRILVIGATRGLGASIVKEYAARQGTVVSGTTRSKDGPKGFPENIKWLPSVDLMDAGVGDTVVKLLGGSHPLSTVVGIPF
jgi:NAD(P)-dependent dehydrogenase (short-subunit alcohol dehydrogenase family)